MVGSIERGREPVRRGAGMAQHAEHREHVGAGSPLADRHSRSVRVKRGAVGVLALDGSQRGVHVAHRAGRGLADLDDGHRPSDRILLLAGSAVVPDGCGRDHGMAGRGLMTAERDDRGGGHYQHDRAARRDDQKRAAGRPARSLPLDGVQQLALQIVKTTHQNSFSRSRMRLSPRWTRWRTTASEQCSSPAISA